MVAHLWERFRREVGILQGCYFPMQLGHIQCVKVFSLFIYFELVMVLPSCGQIRVDQRMGRGQEDVTNWWFVLKMRCSILASCVGHFLKWPFGTCFTKKPIFQSFFPRFLEVPLQTLFAWHGGLALEYGRQILSHITTYVMQFEGSMRTNFSDTIWSNSNAGYSRG
jgi:hypothetical protein